LKRTLKTLARLAGPRYLRTNKKSGEISSINNVFPGR
jgi:hypothetical protein